MSMVRARRTVIAHAGIDFNSHRSSTVSVPMSLSAASSGYLDEETRTKLLSEWAPSLKASKAQLDKARPEIEKLQRAREETASSPRDQRYMPSNMCEAVLVAARDEEEAQEAARREVRSSSKKPASSSMRSRSLSTRAGVTASAARATDPDAPALSSPILKKRLTLTKHGKRKA